MFNQLVITRRLREDMVMYPLKINSISDIIDYTVDTTHTAEIKFVCRGKNMKIFSTNVP